MRALRTDTVTVRDLERIKRETVVHCFRPPPQKLSKKNSRMPRKIRSVAVVSLDFDSIARCNDDGVYKHMIATLSLSRKRMFPKSLEWNAYRVTRVPASVTVHLLQRKDRENELKEVARFGFIPGPDFSRTS